MKFQKEQTLQEIFEKANVLYRLPQSFYGVKATGINEIHKVTEGDITFVDHPKYYKKTLQSSASVILINTNDEIADNKTLIHCENPFDVYNALMYAHSPRLQKPSEQSAISFDGSTYIHPKASIAEHVTIGKNCIIYAHVSIYDNVHIGDNVIIHAGAVIGSDAFYYKKQNGAFDKMYTGGTVIIENDVEIGANTTIDAGVSGTTRIMKGTKIDNLCQIGHGVTIGEHCIVAAHVGIAGKTTIGNNCMIWGQVGINKSLVIGDNVTILAKSGVGDNLESGKTYFGAPAREARVVMREMAAVQRLPDFIKSKMQKE